MNKRAEIIIKGKVQGVGFRHFVLEKAKELKLKGYTENLIDGSVFTIAEGNELDLEKLYLILQKGPAASKVMSHSIQWTTPKNEFKNFRVSQ